MKPAAVQTPEPPARLDPDRATAYLGVRTRRTVMDLARRGDLPCIVYKRGRDGRATVIAFEVRDLDAYIAAHRQEATR